MNNGAGDIPSFLLEPQAVIKSNVKDTVVADGLYKLQEICTAAYAEACKAPALLIFIKLKKTTYQK